MSKKLADTQFRYTPDAGVEEGPVCCGVCGDVMNVERNIFGPRSYVGAMAGKASYYDSFLCPNSAERWHLQVVALREEARKTPSARVDAMMREEALDVLNMRQETKQVSLHYLL